MGGMLLLEDGRVFRGESFGAKTTKVGEVVFNTAMTGYQEAITDPSYCEQILVMTYPHIGNTGINTEDPESKNIWVNGFIARYFSRRHSNHRATDGLGSYLRNAGIPALHRIDTRALVRHIRDKGAMKAVISCDGTPVEQLRQMIDRWPGMEGRALAQEVSTKQVYIANEPPQPRMKVNVIDGGVKENIIRLLSMANCFVRVIPINAPVEAWTSDCDLVFLSNGPGDPAALHEPIQKCQQIIGSIPVVGICLGHQLLSLALGAKTYKLPFGHRGANHPVLDVETKKVEITSQNHGFCVDEKSLVATGAKVTHINLNDKTVAGIVHEDKKIMGIQFHPESCPGPHDSRYLVVERFLEFAEKHQA